ncbi:MAG: sodium:solute symporter family protein [Firmicutes bacterium]|nr:sodium:solute symporter family protein [Bacillota bacterium]
MNSVLGFSILLAYVLVLLIIGGYGARVTRKTREDYFMAGRGLGSIAVFMTLFATNITAFTIIGHAGFSYHAGYGAYGYVIGWSIFITPFTYYLIGYRSWLLGKRYGYATQPQVFGGILKSRAVSLLFLFLLLYYTLPYLVVSIIGGGLAFSTISEGLVPYWPAAAIIVVVSLLYTVPAGMRGTVWTDIFQGALFMVISVLLLFALVRALGGFSAITSRIAAEQPALLQRALSPDLAPANWFSFSFINSIAVVVFPQIFIRIMAARSSRNLKQVTLFYPAAMALIFGISTLLGVWGAVSIPGLVGKDSDNIVPLLISGHLSPLWTILGLLMILAIVKSSIDSQLLTVAHLVTDDLISPYIRISPERAVLWGRIILVLFSAAALCIALARPAAILAIAAFAFSGFSIMLPVMIGVLYWRRANQYGTCAALILPAVMLHLWYLGILPGWTTFGLMPVVPAFFLAVITLVAVSLLTPAPAATLKEKTFGFFARVFEQDEPGLL